MDKRIKRKTRIVGFGNGLFPTKATAKTFGLTEAELGKIFWAGVGTDYKALAARAEVLRSAVPAGKEILVKSPAGTDLKLKLTAKPMNVSDGVISPEEAKAGGAALFTWLPAGEVYGLIDPQSAEGKIVVPRFIWRGQEIRDLTVTVKTGRIQELTAKPSKAFDEWKALYDAAPSGKEALSILDFGVNTDVKAPKGKALQSFVTAGAVTLILGGDQWAGGTNTASWGEALFLTDATLTADGKTVVDKGTLKLEVAAK